VYIRFRCTKKILAAAAAGLFALSLVSAQTVNDEGKRKVKSKSAPVYPELARRMNIVGKVKVEVVIAPDGRVRNTRAIGGHPVLVQACMDAVKEWKYEPASEESTQIIEFDFKQQ
jgi:TonB family protein